MQTWTVLKVLDWTTTRFAKAGYDSARLEAQILLSHVLDCSRVGMYTQFDRPLGAPELGAFRDLVRRRLAGEPSSYLVGEKEFWSLAFHVDSRVLIPRPDTETLISVVLEEVGSRDQELQIADVGTGSGAIAVTLATELPNAKLWAIDISADALELAGRNAVRHSVGPRISFHEGHLLGPLGQHQMHVIAANLPYVERKTIATLSAEVRQEPVLALDGGVDGLDLIRDVVQNAPAALTDEGLLVLEHGNDQGRAVRDLFEQHGEFSQAKTIADLGGCERVTIARKK